MVTEAAHVRIVEQFVPSIGGDSSFANLLAPTREPPGAAASKYLQHMQKTPTDGATRQCNQRYQWNHSMAILRAMVAGTAIQTNPPAERIASFTRHGQIAQSGEDDWREELLFVLEQSLELYDTYLG